MTDLFKLQARSSSIFTTNKFRDNLIPLLENAQNQILICSGFVTSSGIKWLKEIIKSDVKCTIITRWKKMDILQKASDLESYELCKKFNWLFKTVDNCHAKVIAIDDKYVAVSSANITNYGLGLIPVSNKEAGIIKERDPGDKEFFDDLIGSAHTVTNDEYLLIKDWYLENKVDNSSSKIPDLPVKLRPDKMIASQHLWVKDFPLLSFQELSNYNKTDNVLKHELDMLSIREYNYDCVNKEFKNTYIYNWLKRTLESHDQGLYFGGMKDVIRKSLLDDERVFASDLTKLLSNLYSYIKEFDYGELKITKPNHSELIQLNMNH